MNRGWHVFESLCIRVNGQTETQTQACMDGQATQKHNASIIDGVQKHKESGMSPQGHSTMVSIHSN